VTARLEEQSRSLGDAAALEGLGATPPARVWFARVPLACTVRADMTQAAPGAESAKGEPGPGGGAGPGAPGGGSYEVIRRRLLERAGELARRAESLNAKRKEVFGASEMALLANPRVRTEQNCVPRDIVSIRGRLLVGYQVVLGLKAEAKVADLFTLHAFKRGVATGEGGFEIQDIPLAVEPPPRAVGGGELPARRDLRQRAA
jgi:hypothetical protein